MEDKRFMRSAAIWCAIGSVLVVPVSVIVVVDPGVIHTPGMHFVLMAMNAMLLVGLVGLAHSGAEGTALVGRVALGLALLGQGLFIPAELAGIMGANSTDGLLYGIGSLLSALGLIIAGALVLRARRWHGWHAFTPLFWGLYPLIVLFPALALGGLVALLAHGGWGLCSLLLSVALWQEASARQTVQPSLAG